MIQEVINNFNAQVNMMCPENGAYIAESNHGYTLWIRDIGGIKQLKVPEGVTELRRDSEQKIIRASQLTEVSLPKSLTIVGSYALAGATKLTRVIGGNNVIHISAYAFYMCNSLEEINMKSVRDVGVRSFTKCYNLKSVRLPRLNTIKSEAFKEDRSIDVFEAKPIIIEDLALPNFDCIPSGLDLSASNFNTNIINAYGEINVDLSCVSKLNLHGVDKRGGSTIILRDVDTIVLDYPATIKHNDTGHIRQVIPINSHYVNLKFKEKREVTIEVQRAGMDKIYSRHTIMVNAGETLTVGQLYEKAGFKGQYGMN